jgi:hypothetical protein
VGIRRFTPSAVTIGLVLAVILAMSVIGGGHALGAVTTITVLSPDVSVRHGTAGDFVSAVDGEVLESGDAIRTSDAGRAILTYFEGSTVTIEPGTELAIDAAVTEGNDTVVQMTQSVGRTWHVVTKLIGGGSKYEVRTPASTASVRGTAFEVLADAIATTVTTTEGTVVDRVPDPARAGAVVDVPVVAGNAHTQPKDAAPTRPRTAPKAERTVTLTVGATNSVVVDPHGRANGITKQGKVLAQTPGARVRRDGDTIVITLPDLPDGQLVMRVDTADRRDDHVKVHATVEDHGETAELDDDVTIDADRSATSRIEIRRSGDNAPTLGTAHPAASSARTATVRPSATPRTAVTARPERSAASPPPTRTRTSTASPSRGRETDTPSPSATKRP